MSGRLLHPRMFQSTHPRGVRHLAVFPFVPVFQVSIHAPAWGATSLGCVKVVTLSGFNPRTRVGCDGRIPGCLQWRRCVSIHAPAWGATAEAAERAIAKRGFNPRTRVGCDLQRGEGDAARVDVSIHAPAWGATYRQQTELDELRKFQSTHPRGVRLGRDAPARDGDRFNPRTRVGCDRAVGHNLPVLDSVSIHAPAWGATSVPWWAWAGGKVSIHAPAWGATSGTGRAFPARPVSIHAPAWGATRRKCETPADFACFNPRTRVGCDLLYIRHSNWIAGCFNPRTRVGCDDFKMGIIIHRHPFQSTHPRGVRQSTCLFRLRYIGFQSTHPRGVRRRLCRVLSASCQFQSTHPRGVRLDHAAPSAHGLLFQSTHPRGVRPAPTRDQAKRIYWFQSTHPRGVRHGLPLVVAWWREGFNPRTRVGCDVSNQLHALGAAVFQSTHPRGVRLCASIHATVLALFQSTHPRGVRHRGPVKTST